MAPVPRAKRGFSYGHSRAATGATSLCLGGRASLICSNWFPIARFVSTRRECKKKSDDRVIALMSLVGSC
jgi:hypothetical protein